jgi:hypothetical protein
MPRQRYDIGSKWLLHNQGLSALVVGGLKDVQRIEPMPAEIVQNRKYPDGLLRAFLRGESKPYPVLVEVATYPERRALRQAMDDLALAFSALRHLPELLMLVLRPKGSFRIHGRHEVQSELGLSRLEAAWKVVELWTLPAEEFLAAADVGATPWITLMDFAGPPEELLERCADKIEREASGHKKADLLAVAQVMTSLRFPDPELVRLLGGKELMFESPYLQELVAERVHEYIRDALKDRFGSIPRDVTKRLREIIDEKKLRQLNRVAAKCTDMEAFRAALLS